MRQTMLKEGSTTTRTAEWKNCQKKNKLIRPRTSGSTTKTGGAKKIILSAPKLSIVDGQTEPARAQQNTRFGPQETVTTVKTQLINQQMPSALPTRDCIYLATTELLQRRKQPNHRLPSYVSNPKPQRSSSKMAKHIFAIPRLPNSSEFESPIGTLREMPSNGGQRTVIFRYRGRLSVSVYARNTRI
jgi:hypothetical protein